MSAHRGKMSDLSHDELKKMGLRARPPIDWTYLHKRLLTDFGFSDRDDELVKYEISQEDLFKARASAIARRLCLELHGPLTVDRECPGHAVGARHPSSGPAEPPTPRRRTR